MNLAGFALAVLVIELTPGPNMAWLAGLAATEGRRTGMAAVAGIALGLLLNGALAAAGLAALLAAAPVLWTGLRLAGAVMLAVIAVQTWRGSTAATEAAPRFSGRAFFTGLFINLLNPKATLFFVVVAPQFMDGQTLLLHDALILAAVSAAIATLIHIALVVAGSRARPWLADPAKSRTARRLFAVVILGMAASSLLL